MGANAIVGIDLDYEVLGSGNNYADGHRFGHGVYIE
jgi:uncharacterized protein YbjQ (UPF0145 family)